MKFEFSEQERQWIYSHLDDFEEFRYKNSEEMFANELEQLVSTRLSSETASSGEGKKWISVDERLPKEDGEYLVKFTTGERRMGVVSYKKKRLFGFNQYVSHWQPLPNPPQK